MRYGHETFLPLGAFMPQLGRMRLHGGGGNVFDQISDVIGTGGGDTGLLNLVDQAAQGIGDIGASLDDTVNEVIPGGWATVGAAALLAVGIYDPTLLGMAESGSLSSSALVEAGYEPIALAQQTAALSPEVIAASETAAQQIINPALATVAESTLPEIATSFAPASIPAESTLAGFASDVAPQIAGQIAPATASDLAFEQALTNSLYPNAGNVGSGLGSTYGGSTLGTALNGLGTTIPTTELALGQGIANAGTLGSIAAPAAAIGGAGTALGALSGLGGATAASLAAPAAGAGIGSALSSLLPSSALGQAALLSGAGSLGSAYLGANASENAANLQSQAAANATQLTRDMFNTQNAQQAPQRAAGYNALNQIQGLLPGQYQQYDAAGNPTTMGTGTGYLTQQMTPSDYQNYLSPYYQFGLNQGLGQASNQANALGGRVGGNALQGLNQYAQNYAQSGAQQAFNNFRNQRTDIYNTLAGIAGIGQTAQSQTNQLAQNAATNQANLGVGSAGAQAAGQIGQASAYSGALGNIGNNFMLANLLNQKGSIF
jgi:hypothetical protein